MGFTALQNVPIVIDLLVQANTTGWTVDGVNASHDSCNSGFCTLISFPVTAGTPYSISYIVKSISGGNVQPVVGGTNGVARTTANLYAETITAGADGFVKFFSNANCVITSFTIQPITPSDGITVAYSAKNKKWSDFRNLYLDWGWSIYDRVIVAVQGAIYANSDGSASTNNFGGVQYQSSIKFVSAKEPVVSKTYQSISYQGSDIMVTTTDGITTSLGQVSELEASDFLKSTLNDGVTSVNVYSQEGIYSASFLRNKNIDLINGDNLKGNYIIVELVTIDGSKPFRLFTVEVNATLSKVGAR